MPTPGSEPLVRFEIDSEKCVGCLACVRVCSAKAIAVDGSDVRIVDDACVRSGACLPECPHDAIDAIGDVDLAVALSERGDAVLVLAVEAAAHFYPHTPEQVVNACYRAGFRAVHRGVIGDELVAEEYMRLWSDPDWGTMIRSTCPIVVERIRKEYPELVPYLAPIQTPLGAETEYHRTLYGQDVRLVYVGVCLADNGSHVDASLTFQDLEELLRRRGVVLAQEPQYYERIPEVRQRYISTAGGLPLPVLQEEHQASRRFRKMRGLDGLAAVARAVSVDRMDLGFVDILPCEGCLDHPLLGPKEELFWRRRVVADTEPPRSEVPVLDPGVKVGVGRSFSFIVDGERPPEVEVTQVIETIGRAPGGSPWNCGACGYDTCAEFAAAMLRGRATLRQCTPYQERRANEATEAAAVDALTGLSSFRTLRIRLDEEVARSDRNGEPFGLVFADLDAFKAVNDVHGHEVGNRVLAGVGAELAHTVRKTDMAARYGGDEFVLVLVGTDAEGARRVGEVVRASIAAFAEREGFERGEVTASVGAACHDPRSGDPSDPLRAADAALYEAKARGGNTVVVAGEQLRKGKDLT